MNLFERSTWFADRQSALAEEGLAKMDCSELSLVDIYRECWRECCKWYDEGKDDCPQYVRSWCAPDTSVFPPLGIVSRPPDRCSLLTTLCFSVSAAEYNLRSFLEHARSRGKSPYRPLLLHPAVRYLSQQLSFYGSSGEREYIWDAVYYDEHDLAMEARKGSY